MDRMDVMEKLLNIRNFVNRVLAVVYDKHIHIGKVSITNMTELTGGRTTHTTMPGDIGIRYVYNSYSKIFPYSYPEFLEVDETGMSYYDNLIKDILKLIMIEFLTDVPEERYFCIINLDNSNDKIIELSNYSDEELRLYLKLSS